MRKYNLIYYPLVLTIFIKVRLVMDYEGYTFVFFMKI